MGRRLTVIAVAVLIGVAGARLWLQPRGENGGAVESLTFRIELGAVNLDPLTMVDTESRKVATLLHAGLVAAGRDGAVEPRLASSWERVSPTTWRFALRDDVRFSGGAGVDAETVVRSLCAAMQPGSLWSWSLASIAREAGPEGTGVLCTGLRAPAADVVEIEEATPTAWLLQALAGPGGWIVPVDEAPGEYGVRSGIGPYELESFRAGSDIVLAARRDGGAVVPAGVDRIVFRYLPDPIVAARAFSGGDLDMLRIDAPQPYETLVAVDASGARSLRAPGELLSHPFSRMRIVLVGEDNLERRGLGEEEIRLFRRGLSAAIDRERLVQRAPGMAAPWFTAFPPAGAGVAGAAQTTLRSIDRDRPFEGLSLTLLVNNDPYSDLIAASLPSELGGAAITYRAVDFSVIVNAMQEGSYDLVGLLIDATIDVPAFWAAFFRPGAPFLLFGKPLPELEHVNVATAEGVVEAARLVDARGNWVPLYREEGVIALGPRLAGLRLTPSGQVSLESVTVRP